MARVRSVQKKWASQPQEVAGINWAHPRTDRLCFFMPGGDVLGMRDLVRNQALTLTGLGSQVITSQGPSRLFGTGNLAAFTSPPEIGPTTPFTLAWTQEARSPGSYVAPIQVNFGTAGVHYTFLVYQSTVVGSGYRFAVGPTLGGSSGVKFGAALGVLTTNRLDRFVLRVSAGSQDYTAANYTLYRNGIAIAGDGSATSFGTSTAGNGRIGAWAAGTDPFSGAILDVRMWARVLTDDEAAQDSHIQLAAELYEPARVWIPLAGASGYFASLAEAASAADSLSVLLGVFPDVSEAASGADSAAAVMNSDAAVSETISPTDSSTSVYGVTSTTSEAASASDSPSKTLGVSGIVAETLSRTNLLPNSTMAGATIGVIGSGGALPTGWTWGAGSGGLTREVFGVGTLSNGDDYVDLRIYGTNASGSTVFTDIYMTPTTTIAAAVDSKFTFSAYVKTMSGSGSGFVNASTQRRLYVSERSGIGNFLTATSALVDGFRVAVTRTFSDPAVAYAAGYLDMSVAGSATVDMVVRIAAPQLEAGTVATAPIATSGSAVTVTTPSDLASYVYGVTLTDSEAASGADSVSQAYGVTLIQTDSASASDSANTTGGSDVPVTVAESTTAGETQSNVTDFPHTVSESTSPADSPSAVTDFGKTVTESTTASDAQSVTLQLFMVLAELAAAADAASMGLDAFPTISEPANADDFVSNSAAYTLSISEATSSTDQVISIFGYLRSVAESVGATDFASMLLNAVAAAALYTDILDIDGRMYLVAYDGRTLPVPNEVRQALIDAESRTTSFTK